MLLHDIPKRPVSCSITDPNMLSAKEPSKRRRERDRDAHFDPDKWQAVKVHDSIQSLPMTKTNDEDSSLLATRTVF